MNNQALETSLLQSAITIAQTKADGGALSTALSDVAQTLLKEKTASAVGQQCQWVRGAYAGLGSPLHDGQSRDMSAQGKLALLEAVRRLGADIEEIDAIFLALTAGTANAVDFDWPQPEIEAGAQEHQVRCATPRPR